MTVADSTINCQVCGKDFYSVTNKDGAKRKRKYSVCSKKCYNRLRYPDTKPMKTPKKGRFSATCSLCGIVYGSFKYSESIRRKYCSLQCAGKANALLHISTAPCLNCGESFVVTNDRKLYCSNQCSSRYRLDIAKENQKAANERKIEYRANVLPELRAIRKLSAAVRQRTRKCCTCQDSYIRLRKYYRYCSAPCEDRANIEAKKRSKQLESTKAAKRRAKSKRKALQRGVNSADKIDPVAVFERDKWICHICGDKTIKEYRGKHYPKSPELDHIVTIADGGQHVIGNVACSCRKCNGKKGAKSFGQLLMAM